MSTYTPVRSRFRSAITAIPSDFACAIRPARPGDEALVRVMLERCSGEDLRQRCHGSDKGFPVSFARRVARCEDPGEIALIALTEDGEVVGIVHAIADLAQVGQAEYDLLVRSDLKRRGIGSRLMNELMRLAERFGLRTLWADVLVSNSAMLHVADSFGFHCVGQNHGLVHLIAPAAEGAAARPASAAQ